MNRCVRYGLGLVLCLAVLGQLGQSSLGQPRSSGASSDKLQKALAQVVASDRVDRAMAKWQSQAKAVHRGIPVPDLQDGKIQVIIEANSPADTVRVREALAAARAQVELVYESLIQARVPLGYLESLSARADVRFIRLPVPPTLDQGRVTSEGVPVIGSKAWNAAGLDGNGTKVGILDFGFQNLTALINRGELPGDRVVQRSFRRDGEMFDRRSPSAHGTAVTEIVNDVAPQAALYTTAFNTDAEFRQAVDYLIQQKVDVISTSFSYPSGCFNRPGRFENTIAKARNNQILWTSSAGNNADAHWQGPWQDDDNDRLHNFKGTDEFETIEVVLEPFTYPDGQQVATFVLLGFLSWEAPNCRAAGTDYDVTFFDEFGLELPILGDGVGQLSDWFWEPRFPVRIFLATLDYPTREVGTIKKIHLAIRQRAGVAPAALDLVVRCCSLASIKYLVPEGSISIFEPAISPNAMAVGAFHHDPSRCPRWAPCPNGLLAYSSRGPTKDGRVKPDIAAPSHVSTNSFGAFRGGETGQGFNGTSAAQPHVAGAVALVKQAFPGYTPEQLQDFLEKRAEDRGAPGKDNDWGAGALVLGQVPSARPAAPSELAAQARAAREISLTWKDNSENEDGFKIERRLQSDPASSYAEIGRTGANTTSFTDTNVQPGTGYCYRVRSYTAGGDSDYSNESCVLTLAENRLPIADPGPDQTVTVGDVVQLDGSRSSDPDGDALKYNWAFVNLPAGSQAQLSDASIVNPTFRADVAGEYIVELTVEDPQGGRGSARVKILARSAPAAVATLVTLKFAQLVFVTPGWNRELQSGCVVYQNGASEEGRAQFALANGDAQEYTIPAGQAILVCGDVGHFASAGAPRAVEGMAATGAPSALKFARLDLGDSAHWERGVREGCLIYKNIRSEPNTLKITRPNGAILEVSVGSGKEIFVCGDVVHLE